jgi:PAS domain-containing protein
MLYDPNVHSVSCQLAMNEQQMTKDDLIAELHSLRKRIAELEMLEQLHGRVQDELHRSEERFRSLVDSTEDSIYVVDLDCNYLFLNRKHRTRLGLASEDGLNGKSYLDFHSPAEAADFHAYVDTVLQTGRSISQEYRAERDN